MNNKKKRTILTVILAAIMVVCIVAVVVYYARQSRAENAYGDMRENAVTDTAGTTELPQTEQAEPHGTYEGMPEVDFQKLWEVNTDICAWITIPGTQIDYPIVQNASATDPYDAYYLQHTVERASGLPGAIYIEPCNASDFSDANTVAYGHNMKNGSMFGDLHKFDDDTFFREHDYVYVVTPEKHMVYQIFGAVVYDDRHIMRTYDFTAEQQYQQFLDSLKESRNMGNHFKDDVTVTTEDRMITLSTCIKGEDTKRLLLTAVLVDEYE